MNLIAHFGVDIRTDKDDSSRHHAKRVFACPTSPVLESTSKRFTKNANRQSQVRQFSRDLLEFLKPSGRANVIGTDELISAAVFVDNPELELRWHSISTPEHRYPQPVLRCEIIHFDKVVATLTSKQQDEKFCREFTMWLPEAVNRWLESIEDDHGEDDEDDVPPPVKPPKEDDVDSEPKKKVGVKAPKFPPKTIAFAMQALHDFKEGKHSALKTLEMLRGGLGSFQVQAVQSVLRLPDELQKAILPDDLDKQVYAWQHEEDEDDGL